MYNVIDTIKDMINLIDKIEEDSEMENQKLTVVQVISRIETLKDEINKYTQVYYKLDDEYDELRRFIRYKKAIAQERLSEYYRMEVIEHAND